MIGSCGDSCHTSEDRHGGGNSTHSHIGGTASQLTDVVVTVPQQFTMPNEVRAQVCSYPALICTTTPAITGELEVGIVGTPEEVAVPSPSCPAEFLRKFCPSSTRLQQRTRRNCGMDPPRWQLVFP